MMIVPDDDIEASYCAKNILKLENEFKILY